jgi:predicted house-cleaning NTP pyrophosphatase (Maf/HAM1 superfamily)
MTKLLLIFLFIFFLTLPLFAQSVDTAWVRSYNGPGNGTDKAYAIAVDGSGCVYVTGHSYIREIIVDYATIKYYPNGDTAWIRRYIGPGDYYDAASAIAVDDSGNVYVTGSGIDSNLTYEDYATVKYYPNGDTGWVRRYRGPGNYYDKASGIAVDGFGNVYVTGTSTGTGTSYDYATIKYYPNGDTAWVRRYNGPGNYYDKASAIAVDGSGNVYVTGSSYGIATNENYATIKYYPNGDTAWVRRYSGSANFYDAASAVAVDRSGNIYVTGVSYGTGTSSDYATIKYYPNGDTAWVRRYNGPGNWNDQASAIVLDDSVNVYVTGYTSYGNGTSSDYATIKYYPGGDTAWVRRYNATGNDWDKASAIAVDSSGNVYVTGSSAGGGTVEDYATIKYYSNGDTGWVRKYNGTGNDYDYASGIAVDGSGNVYVTGYSYGSGTAYDYATIKYVQFLRGDANKDKKVTVSDIVFLVSYLFKHGPAPNPIQSGDANCDGKVTVGDIVYLVSYLFKHGAVPCQ